MYRAALPSVAEDDLSPAHSSVRGALVLLGKWGAIGLGLAIVLGLEVGPSPQTDSLGSDPLQLQKVEGTDNHYQVLTDHRQNLSRLHIEFVTPGGNDNAHLVYGREDLGYASLSMGRWLRLGVNNLSPGDRSANIRTPVAKTTVTSRPDGSVRIVINKETGDYGTLGEIWIGPDGKLLSSSKIEP